jgi:uncharacterized protein (TIGR02266 family)
MQALVRTILVAHREAEVRERFAAALAEANCTLVSADSAETAIAHLSTAGGDPVQLALVDLRLAAAPMEFLRALRRASTPPAQLLVFASTVAGADRIPVLAGMGISGFVNDHAASPHILPALAPYLFPDNFNRRVSPRVSLGVPISYRAGHIIAGAVTLDVGKGGLAVRTMTPLPPGTGVQIKFRLPGTGADLEAAGRVTWSDRKVGMGVQFEVIEPADQATVDAFVDAHQPNA